MSGTLTLDDIVNKTSDLPTIPAAAIAVMRETEIESCTARSVAQHLACDQALSSRVLRLANSAYYGMSRQVTDLQESVVLLGMRSVRNLAVIAATYTWMQRPMNGYALEPSAMWKHSFGVAIAAQLIAKQSKSCDPELAFTAGLLHNLGKVAMNIWLDQKLAAVMSLAQRDHLAFDEVERKLLGFDHADVGAHLAEIWNLPAAIVAPIRFHHRPNEADPICPVTDCVHIGDFLTMSMGYGLGGDGLRYNFCPESLTRLGIEPTAIDEITDLFMDAYVRYEKLIEGMKAA
jgi:putative nucleotidyltransferase with HDIG domain